MVKCELFPYYNCLISCHCFLLQLKELSFIQITDAGELIILGTQDMDAGIYRCVATNEAGETEASVELKVGCK